MIRTVTTLFLAALLTAASAQEGTYDSKETDAMKANADQRTELVAQTVDGLDDAQRESVYLVYMNVEHHMQLYL